MADTLILNAGTSAPLVVPCTKAGKQAPKLVGAVSNAFAGNERSSIRREMQLHQYVTSPITSYTAHAIESLFALGASIPVSGSLFRGFIVSCAATVHSDTVPGLVGDDGFPMVTMTLDVREV